MEKYRLIWMICSIDNWIYKIMENFFSLYPQAPKWGFLLTVAAISMTVGTGIPGENFIIFRVFNEIEFQRIPWLEQL